tara:strand:- start:7052 stop:7522 length:471 start_codon:yes stop_codon:yes gene_type:complete
MIDNWLKASHLMRDRTYTKFTLTIKEVDPPDHGRRYDNKKPIEGYILRFTKTDKEFVIKEGSTNHKLIKAQLGNGNWVGQNITFFPVVGDWFDETNLLAIRIFVDKENPRPKIAAKDMGRSIIGMTVGSQSEIESENLDIESAKEDVNDTPPPEGE